MKNSKTRRKQCSTRGCRKGRIGTSGYCSDHDRMEAESEFGTSVEMDPIDAEAWGRIMAELESASLRAQNKALQLQVSERDWVAQQKALREELQALQAEMVGLQKRYQGIVDRLSKQYDIDPQHVAIDFEARLLYDTRKTGDSSGGEK